MVKGQGDVLSQLPEGGESNVARLGRSKQHVWWETKERNSRELVAGKDSCLPEGRRLRGGNCLAGDSGGYMTAKIRDRRRFFSWHCNVLEERVRDQYLYCPGLGPPSQAGVPRSAEIFRRSSFLPSEH